MNVRLEYQTQFSAGIVYEGQYHINHYSMTINMLTNTLDAYEQNIAFDRIKHWIHNVANHSVFINQTDSQVEAYQQTSQRVIALPEEPFDQTVELMLYVKLESIIEDRMLITDIKLSSTLGDEVCYLHNDEESVGPFGTEGWWTLPTPHWSVPIKNKKKVVSLPKGTSWDELELSWEREKDVVGDSSVVFADFTANETK